MSSPRHVVGDDGGAGGLKIQDSRAAIRLAEDIREAAELVPISVRRAASS
jgi:hypothetical protein